MPPSEDGLFDQKLRSWLIDVDRDSEGLQVLVDLHGGDPEDIKAKIEYNEIRDLVVAEVRDNGMQALLKLSACASSANRGMIGRTSPCGGNTSVVYFWPCLPRLLHSL